MSYVFEIGTHTVWSPALRVGRVYFGYAQVLEEVLGQSAGFEELASDMIRIEFLLLTDFAQKIVEASLATNNETLIDQLGVVLIPSLVMLQRAGGGHQFDANSGIVEAVHLMSGNMPQ